MFKLVTYLIYHLLFLQKESEINSTEIVKNSPLTNKSNKLNDDTVNISIISSMTVKNQNITESDTLTKIESSSVKKSSEELNVSVHSKYSGINSSKSNAHKCLEISCNGSRETYEDIENSNNKKREEDILNVTPSKNDMTYLLDENANLSSCFKSDKIVRDMAGGSNCIGQEIQM